MIENLPPLIRANIIVDDCWIWTGCLDANGYGYIRWQRRTQRLHRLVFGLLIRAVARSEDVHHICKNRRCCNPVHMDVFSHGEHTALHNPAKESCKHGHTFDDLNTHRTKTGKRSCRKCRAINQRLTRERRKGALLDPYNSDKKFCPQEHHYDDLNTYFYGRARQCRKCRAERARQFYLKNN